jgi:hypothetical protein
MRISRIQLRKIIKEVLGPTTEIYCDMDGVLVDFVQGASRLANSVLDGNEPEYYRSKTVRRSIRRIHRDLGAEWRVAGGHDLDIKPVRSMMMAAVSLRAGEFFRDLRPLDDGINLLWPFLNSTGLNVNILSAPIGAREGITTSEGKFIWTQQHLNPKPTQDNFIIIPAIEKQNYAVTSAPNILIDDKTVTIEQWNAQGGIGLLHTPGESQLTIVKLQEILGMY